MDLKTFLGGTAFGIGNTSLSILNAGVKGATSLMTTALEGARKYQAESMVFAKSMGLSLKESQAYMGVLTRRAAELGWQYGVDAEKILELQKNLSDATGKALMLNDAEAERMLQINQLVGTQVANQFTEELMNGMGAQLSTVQGAISKAYTTAAKSGLNASKFSETVAKNLSMANRLSFRDGVNGLTRMAAFSEKIGMNMQSVESAAGQFLELDKSIENAAQMQMLGGSAAAMFGNPLTAAYEANYDPETFAKRLSNSLGSYASFDRKTGMASINGMNMDFVRNIAKVMGISTEEASKMAKKQAEIRYKEGAFGSTLGNLRSQEERDFVLNKSYVDTQTGRLMINDINGKPIDVTNGLPRGLMEELTKYEGMSDTDIMKKQASTLVSIDDKLKGLETSTVAKLAQGASTTLEGINKLLTNTGTEILNKIDELSKSVGNKINEYVDLLNSHQKTINSIIGAISNGLKFIVDNFTIFFLINAAVGGLMTFFTSGSFITGFKAYQNMFGSGSKTAHAAAKPSTSAKPKVSTKYKGDTWYKNENNKWVNSKTNKLARPRQVQKLEQLYKASSKTASGAVSKTASSAVSKTASTASKVGTKVIGTSVAIGASSIFGGIGVHEYRDTIKELNKALEEGTIEQEEYNAKLKEAKDAKNMAVGGGIGAAVGGVLAAVGSFGIGTAAGAAIGDIVGMGLGWIWTNISDSISDLWNGPIRDLAGAAFGEFGTTMVDATGRLVDGITDSLGYQIEAVFGLIGDIVMGWWEGVKSAFSTTWNGIVKIFHGDFKEGFIDVIKAQFMQYSGIAKGILDGIKSFFGALGESFNSLFKGIGGYFSGIKSAAKILGFSDGGIVGGDSRAGDKVLARVNSAEMILNTKDQSNLFTFIKSIPAVMANMMSPRSEVLAKPIGEKEYIYIPNKSETSNINGNSITVKDFNINLNGTIKLDGGNSSKNIDVNALLNDYEFVSKLKELIKTSINTDMNGGRYMNDLAIMRGHISSSSIIR